MAEEGCDICWEKDEEDGAAWQKRKAKEVVYGCSEGGQVGGWCDK